jgi:maltose alpha-D-glucosyltransferase/alpha-amylase
MQWTDEPHGGFTRAEPFRPVVTEAPYGYPQVNVETQRRDPASLLNWMERMVRMRKECPELGWGAWRLLRVKPENVLALRFDWKGETLVTLHNLSGKACEVSFSPGGPSARLVHMLSEAHSQPGKGGRHRVTLEGYGYRWFRMEPLDT